MGKGKEHLSNYLNSKSEYVDKLKDEVNQAYRDYVAAIQSGAIWPLVGLSWLDIVDGGREGDIVDKAEKDLLALGDNCPMQSLVATGLVRIEELCAATFSALRV